MARPRKEVDEKQIEELAGIGCTVAEIAAVSGVSKDTLERRFAVLIEKGRETAKSSLRHKQFQVAMSSNVGMLIWLPDLRRTRRPRHQCSNSRWVDAAQKP